MAEPAPAARQQAAAGMSRAEEAPVKAAAVAPAWPALVDKAAPRRPAAPRRQKPRARAVAASSRAAPRRQDSCSSARCWCSASLRRRPVDVRDVVHELRSDDTRALSVGGHQFAARSLKYLGDITDSVRRSL